MSAKPTEGKALGGHQVIALQEALWMERRFGGGLILDEAHNMRYFHKTRAGEALELFSSTNAMVNDSNPRI